MSNPNYYAIIPANVRYSDVAPSAKLLYGELTALTSREGFCWAPNRYFAELYGVDVYTITRWFVALEKKGFIKTEVDKNAGNTRKIWLTTDKFGKEATHKNVGTYPQKEQSLYIRTTENSPVAKATVPFEVVSDEPRREQAKRDKRAWALRDKLYTLFEVPPLPSTADYMRVVDALKHLTEKQIIEIVEDEVSRGKKRTVAEMLTKRSITIYLQDNA